MTSTISDDSFRRRFRTHAVPLCVIALAIGAAYASTWTASYGFMDDYNITFNSSQHHLRILQNCIAQGRPLDGVILNAVFGSIHTIAAIARARELGQLFIVIAAFVFYAAMVRTGWPRSLAAGMAVVCGTLPAMQVYAAWGTEVAQPLAAAAAGMAAILAASSGEAGIAAGRRWGLRSGAAASLLAAALIYQPAAMVFWVFAAIDLLRPNIARSDSIESTAGTSDLPRAAARYAIVAAVAMAGAAVALWWGLRHPVPRLYPGESASERAALVGLHDLPDKWAFFRTVVGMAMNLTNINTQSWVAVAVGLLIVTGLPLYARRGSGRWKLLAVAAALVPLTYLPNLVVKNNWPSFRTQVAIESLVALFVLMAMQGWWQIAAERLGSLSAARAWLPAIWMALLAGASVFAAADLVKVYFVRPQTTELGLAQHLLNAPELSAASRVKLIGADWSDTAAPAVYYEEFGQPSSYRPWAGVSMIRLLLAEQHPAYRDLPVDFSASALPAEPGAMIIDMRQLRGFRNVGGG
jgi:hypothetical protein